MDFNRAKSLLFKIQTLLDSISDPQGKGMTSRLERDLLLSYIRDLYDTISSDEAFSKSTERAAFVPQAHVQPPEIPRKDRATEVFPDIQDMPPDPEDRPKKDVIQQATREVAVPEEHGPEPVQPRGSRTPTFMESSTLEDLFAEQPVSDLSAKFRQTPITDISKAMGINEKILTVNELFGGSQDLYNETVHTLHAFQHFDQAKNFLLSGVASDLDWADDSRIEKAKQFIHYVRRKYLV